MANSFGDDCLFTFHWVPATVGGSVADASDALARFAAGWATLGAKIASGCVITFDPFVETFESTTGALLGGFAGTQPSNITTSGGSSPLPGQTQGLIRWNTGVVRGKRFLKGRTFVPVPDEGDNTGTATPSSSYTSQLAAAVADFLDTGPTATAPVVWGRPNNPAANNGVVSLIASGTASTTWASQRGRR